ncbi:MAG: 1-acylglycerol-3-phosphate O-acyltransferase [Nocardia sp.]|nr:1-acylglycerol-3-phosphate O-acyltransferase [Nocardia sp.]
MNLADAVSAIRSGPRGSHIPAVFDVAGTVVAGFTPAPAPVRLLRRGDGAALTELLRTGINPGDDETFLRRAEPLLAGRTEEELTTLGEDLFRRTVHAHLYPEAWQLIREHEAAGHTLILVTALTRFQVEPIAAELGIDYALCTPMATSGGVLTGYPAGEPLRGKVKAAALHDFAAARGIDLASGYTYATAESDLPTLESAGKPTAVNPAPDLARTADERGWPTLTFRPRKPPKPIDIARTAVGFAGLLTGAALGTASRATTRDRETMAGAMMTTAADTTLRSTGIRVRITGEEYARAPRPAVFLFNHQSQFDMVVLAEVLRGGFTGIVKQEVRTNPIFGPLLRFAGATFIDRSDTASAKAAMAPVVETLRGGLSIVIAPEGTRSMSPRIGPFKKGAFHIAIEAGVPIIPVVIRNAGEIAWRNSPIVRKGTVDVAVLAPIDVREWDRDDMNTEIEQVRELFTATLRDWPTG